MKRFLLALSCAAFFAGLCSTAAHATEVNYFLTSFTVTNPSTGVFDFSFTGTSDSGSGVMDATALGGGVWNISSITGTTDGASITSLLPVDTYPAPLATNDNLLYYPPAITFPNAGAAYLDISGLSYMLTGGAEINLYYGVFTDADPESYNLITGTPPGTTPEPSSLLLLGTGALGLAAIAAMRRRRFAPAQPTRGACSRSRLT